MPLCTPLCDKPTVDSGPTVVRIRSARKVILARRYTSNITRGATMFKGLGSIIVGVGIVVAANTANAASSPMPACTRDKVHGSWSNSCYNTWFDNHTPSTDPVIIAINTFMVTECKARGGGRHTNRVQISRCPVCSFHNEDGWMKCDGPIMKPTNKEK